MAQNRDQVIEAFELFDSDGDGYLLVSEAASAIRALGHILTDADVKVCCLNQGVNPGRGGRIDINKFRQMHGSLPPQNYTRQLEEAFKTVDKDGSGYVMATELKHLLTNMGDKLSNDDFTTLLEELDIDSNGRIQFKEFVRLLTAPNFIHFLTFFFFANFIWLPKFFRIEFLLDTLCIGYFVYWILCVLDTLYLY
ncbi:putative calcium-binding protein cml13 [Bulinus truncatus]|nr:putative calcium-binding protein cml13 [Bulinus truncatus]